MPEAKNNIRDRFVSILANSKISRDKAMELMVVACSLRKVDEVTFIRNFNEIVQSIVMIDATIKECEISLDTMEVPRA